MTLTERLRLLWWNLVGRRLPRRQVPCADRPRLSYESFTYIPLPDGVPLTREVLREHFEAMGGTFGPAEKPPWFGAIHSECTDTAERTEEILRAEFGPPARAHYHNADATPITGGWACYCDHPETSERP